MKKVVIYPGRFQPMLSHHVKVYRAIEQMFPEADVYIGTSDKVEAGKSPFNFEEKRQIAKAHGIDPSKVLLAPRPYHNMDYEANFSKMSDNFDPEKVEIFFAVGEKDVRERFPMNNLDAKTGLDMKVRGEPGPKYYQMINTYKQDPQPMSVRGYIAPIENVMDDMEEVSSASAFRVALNNAPDIESAKQIFTRQFGEMNNQVFDLVYKKIVGEKMSEDLNILRKLAGMDVQEDAPVEFETEINPGKVMFLEPGKSSAQYSIANRFPEGSDPNDPEVKKEQFIQALLKSPANLLSEINERIDPKDENSLAVSTKLSKIIDTLTDRYKEGSLLALDDDDKKFAMKVVQVAIKDMDLVAGDDSEPEDDMKPEPTELDALDSITNPMDKKESVDLSDIRSDYGIEENTKDPESKGDCESCHGTGYKDGNWSGESCPVCDGDGEEPGFGGTKAYEGKVKDMAMDQAEAFYDKVAKFVDDQNDIEQAIVSAWEDSEDNPPDWALDDETKDILIQNNLLQPEQEEPEMEESALEGDLEQESFDHSAEQSREEEEYNRLVTAYENSEEDLAEVLGMSMEELDQEMTEFAMERGLHMDDDRDEVVHGWIESLVDNADWKDHGEQDYDRELTDDLNRLRKLSGLEETGTKTVNGVLVYSDGSPLNFSDWRSETERETGQQDKRSKEELKDAYQEYLNRCGDK